MTLPRPAQRIALNTWTLDTTPLTDAVRIARETGYPAIEVRAVDFEKAADRVRAIEVVRDSGLAVVSLGALGVLVQASDGEQQAWFRTLEGTARLADMLGCGTIMASTGMVNATTIVGAAKILSTAGSIAADRGLRIAYEFNALHPSMNRLDTALELIAAVGADNVGLALDSYHLHRSGTAASLEDIPREKLFCVQISDVPSREGEQAPPLDRLQPGQGAVDWMRLFRFLDTTGYGGLVAIEMPNPAVWARDPRQVAAESLAAVTELWERSRRPA